MIQVINLTVNGEAFVPYLFDYKDNIDAIMHIGKTDVFNIRVKNGEDVTVTALTAKSKLINSIDVVDNLFDNYVPAEYLADMYQEFIYPFFEDQVINNSILYQWAVVDKNMTESEDINIVTGEQIIVIKLNDIGLSIDYYDDINESPITEDTVYFDDFKIDESGMLIVCCPECSEAMVYCMLDTDGTNLEEGYECSCGGFVAYGNASEEEHLKGGDSIRWHGRTGTIKSIGKYESLTYFDDTGESEKISNGDIASQNF